MQTFCQCLVLCLFLFGGMSTVKDMAYGQPAKEPKSPDQVMFAMVLFLLLFAVYVGAGILPFTIHW